MPDIMFAHEVQFTGRNGDGRQTGLIVSDYTNIDPNRIDLVPITSRGHRANCSIEVPKESLPELISVLTKIWTDWASSQPGNIVGAKLKEQQPTIAISVQQGAIVQTAMSPNLLGARVLVFDHDYAGDPPGYEDEYVVVRYDSRGFGTNYVGGNTVVCVDTVDPVSFGPDSDIQRALTAYEAELARRATQPGSTPPSR